MVVVSCMVVMAMAKTRNCSLHDKDEDGDDSSNDQRNHDEIA